MSISDLVLIFVSSSILTIVVFQAERSRCEVCLIHYCAFIELAVVSVGLSATVVSIFSMSGIMQTLLANLLR